MRICITYLAVLIFLFSFSNCNQKEKSPLVPDNGLNPDLVKNPESASGENNANVPVFSFEREIYNFGMITEGDKVSYSFTFENTGKSDLVISNAQASCGCTVAEFPKEPIPPGKRSSINVVFNSTGKNGYQRKDIEIKANTIPNVKKLTLTGMVLTKKK
jgi:Protein of unknown function (DUF1573)